MKARWRLLLLVVLVAGPTFAGDPDAGAWKGRTLEQVKLLYFHATWCSSCKRLDEARVVERLVERLPGLKVQKVDVDTQVPMLERYGVTVTPTLVLVDASGFPLGRPAIDLDRPDETLQRAQKLIKKMTRPR